MESYNDLYGVSDTKSIFMESFLSDFLKSMQAITKLLTEYGIRFCFIGGSTLPFYNYRRQTEDIDIIIDSRDRDKLKDLPIGYIKDLSQGRLKVFKLHEPETRIDIITSGESMGNSNYKFPKPDAVSDDINNLPVINLYDLIRFKIIAGIYGKRLKDFGDVQELIKKNNLNENLMNNEPNDIKNKYIEIWNN
jgi:hypothetical protein